MKGAAFLEAGHIISGKKGGCDLKTGSEKGKGVPWGRTGGAWDCTWRGEGERFVLSLEGGRGEQNFLQTMEEWEVSPG